MSYKYKHVGLGGTFDLLHNGHIALLKKAFNAGQLVSIGVTTDKFCKQLGKTPFENQLNRRKNLKNYLNKHKLLKRARLFWESDVYGSAVEDKTMEAVVVSKETERGANQINKERAKLKLKRLKIILVAQIKAYNGQPISSGRIRNGEINKAGKSYLQFLQKISAKQISKTARQKLKKPFGTLTKIDKSQAKKYPPYIAIGDITVKNFLAVDTQPKISIIDFLVERQKMFNQLSELGFAANNPDVIVKNIPGQISADLITAVKKSQNVKNRSIILVDGEEDLAAIPAILLSPLGKYIYYGQPQRGAVKVEVTEKVKEEVVKLLVE